jgi:hypothetical protein
MRHSLAAALLLAGLAAPARADDELLVSEPAHGFRITRPDDSWITYSSEGATPDAAWTLSLYPRDSQGLPSAVVYVKDHDGKSTAEDVRAAAIKLVEGRGQTVLALDEAPLDGRTAARLHVRAAAADGRTYEAELRYLVVPPLVYAVQVAWDPAGGPSAALQSLFDSFATFPPERAAPDADTERLTALAARCGSELPWATSWDDAAQRARDEGRLVLVFFEHYTVLDVPHTQASGELMDEDVVALAQACCVALRLGIDDPSPFRDVTAWGMGSHSWGGLALVVTPDGEVRGQLGVNNAFLLADMLRAALEHPDLTHDPRPLDARLDRAQECLARGDFAGAESLLADADSPRGHRLRADLRRQQRRGEDALAELAAAKQGADDALLADIAVEQAVVQLRLARWTEAGATLRDALERWPEGPRADEAQWWLGCVEMLTQGFPAGRERWRALADAHVDSRWAWKAAANVLDGGAFVNGGERLDWPAPEVFAAAAEPASAPLSVNEAQRAERDARAFLLASQQPDGSWVSPMDAFTVGNSGYTLAVTAVCGSSLLPDRERDPAVEVAVGRARDFLLASHAAGRLAGGRDLMGVYSIWARALSLRFLAQCRGARLGDADGLDSAIESLLASVLDSQHERGGWPYVVISGHSAEGLDPSASFLTAGVILALLDVRAAGVDVPQGPIARGLAFLQRLRQPDGAFRYFADVPELPGNPEGGGRGPVCALALLRGGVGNRDDLRTALAAFDAQRAALRREWGKDVCHTGPEGQGAHYLFYDWAFAAAAVAELPPSDRAPWRKSLLQDILAQRDAEGAYVDMPALGRAYGTAMALAAFRALSR